MVATMAQQQQMAVAAARQRERVEREGRRTPLTAVSGHGGRDQHKQITPTSSAAAVAAFQHQQQQLVS